MDSSVNDNIENMIRDIQTDRVIYQISSSSDTKKIISKMKRDIEEITKAMENALRISYEKRITGDELKIDLAEKKDKIKKMQQDLEQIRKHAASITKKVLEFETEANKVKNAIEKIKEASQELESNHLEKAQSELNDSLLRIMSETEKVRSDLNVVKRKEASIVKKLQDAENDFNQSEYSMQDSIREAERIEANVNTTIEHIVRSFDEITKVSKELLKSSISTNLELQMSNEKQDQLTKESTEAKITA